jgi:two-component system CheB/CheR fusion protein
MDVREAVSNALEEVRPFLVERQHVVKVDLPRDPVVVAADAARLEQVFANLLHNAAKYTQPGGTIAVSVTIRTERDRIQDVGPAHPTSMPHPLSFVEVRVRDTGIGIRTELVDRIFDMFTQGDRVSGRLKEGLGLGLTLVKTLVEMHGGTVGVTSRGHGKGSEFTVLLPVVDRSEPGQVIGPLRVLVVDGNRDAADTLRMVLEAQGGHSVCVTYDGAAGLSAARAFQPDVALVDLGLPHGSSGYEVARQLHAVPGLERTPVVALTGRGGDKDWERSGPADFAAHLAKPVDPNELREVLSQLPTR